MCSHSIGMKHPRQAFALAFDRLARLVSPSAKQANFVTVTSNNNDQTGIFQVVSGQVPGPTLACLLACFSRRPINQVLSVNFSARRVRLRLRLLLFAVCRL